MSYLMFQCQFGVEKHDFTFVFVDGETGLLKPREDLVSRFGEFGGGGMIRRARHKYVPIVNV